MGRSSAEEGGGAKQCRHLVEQSEIIFGPRGGAGPAPDVGAHSWPSPTTPFGHCDRSVGVTFSVAPLKLDKARCRLNPTALVACDHVSATCRGEFRECLANPEVVKRIRGEWQGSRESALARAEAKPDYIWEDIQCWIDCAWAKDIVTFAMQDLKPDQALGKFEVWENAEFALELTKALFRDRRSFHSCGGDIGRALVSPFGKELAIFLAERHDLDDRGEPWFLTGFSFWTWRNHPPVPWRNEVFSHVAKTHWFDVLCYAKRWVNGVRPEQGYAATVLEEGNQALLRQRRDHASNVVRAALDNFESWKGEPLAFEMLAFFADIIPASGSTSGDLNCLQRIFVLLNRSPEFGDSASRTALYGKLTYRGCAA